MEFWISNGRPTSQNGGNVLAALFLAANSGYDTVSGKASDGQRTEQPQKPSEVRYVCPMHPEVKSKTPGTCRKYRMILEKKRIVKTG
jgi:hypothetical protein